MSYRDDLAYYSRRAAEEMERGNQAIHPAVAAIHLDLARRYSMLAANPRIGLPELTLVDGGSAERAQEHRPRPKGTMKLYRVNKLSADKDAILKKTDMLANGDRQAMQAAAESSDCPICEVWSDGMKVGTVK